MKIWNFNEPFNIINWENLSAKKKLTLICQLFINTFGFVTLE